MTTGDSRKTDAVYWMKAIRDLGADTAAVLDPRSIPVCPAFRDACAQNRCGMWGKNWSCPPAEPADAFCRAAREAHSAIVFQQRTRLEDPFDAEGMQSALEHFRALTRGVAERLPECTVYGTGPCSVCEACSYPAPCRSPARREKNLEAAAVDVAAMCAAAGLEYAASPPSVTYTGLALL